LVVGLTVIGYVVGDLVDGDPVGLRVNEDPVGDPVGAEVYSKWELTDDEQKDHTYTLFRIW
jgi:hypothetical protein